MIQSRRSNTAEKRKEERDAASAHGRAGGNVAETQSQPQTRELPSIQDASSALDHTYPVLEGLLKGAPHYDLQQIGISASQNGFSEKATLRRR